MALQTTEQREARLSELLGYAVALEGEKEETGNGGG